MPTTNDIEIVLNGEARNVPPGCTLAGLLHALELDPTRVAIEHNRSIVRRPEWDATVLETGATVEIVQFVGGG
jgi:thiamine biosynthesis protein ThiS